MLREELGDLLLQVVFHAQIEQEQAHFTLEDVCTEICEKMIVRHPHVFSTVQADTTEDVLKNWDTIKEETKHQTTRTETLEAVAKTLPALMRAQKVSKRAAKGKGHFLCKESALASVTECKHTLEQAVYLEDKDELTRAMGEMLFCCASAAQHFAFRRTGADRYYEPLHPVLRCGGKALSGQRTLTGHADPRGVDRNVEPHQTIF